MLNNYDDIIKELENIVGHKVELFYDIINEDFNKNNCWCAGDEIGIGIYEDAELEMLGFFHECGHILNKTWDCKRKKYDNERDCWIDGLEFAKSLGYKFKYSKIKWCIKNQLNSYIGYEEWYR